MTAHNAESERSRAVREAQARYRSLKNAKRKRGSAQPQEREAQAAACSLKNAKRKRGSVQPQEIDRPYSSVVKCRDESTQHIFAAVRRAFYVTEPH